MGNRSWFLLTSQKLLKALIIGISCLFFGILLATLSPIMALFSLLHRPKEKPPLSDRWSESLKKIEDRIREIKDPDFKENWKKEHYELYGDIDGSSDPKTEKD